eukprot:TRINITY_DN32345_c0_g1_i2.p1 TRINITY_DN32345_c0_g1~~TRINITY_DN32345_c0_g1_i2.p1  ORF type:complete len:783 (+),score=155.47 TRINITY_DN32345_c0_g1_i2:44-2392(+)
MRPHAGAPPKGRGRGGKLPGADVRSNRPRGASDRTGSTPRGTPRGLPPPAPGGSAWAGVSFYLQIERCHGVSEHTVSVRLDEELYVQKSEALKAGINDFFEGAFEVVTMDVPTLYACEVRVMPEQCHPRHGRKVFAEDAVANGGETIFAKTVTKKWPKVQDICAQLQDFMRIPLTIQLLANEQNNRRVGKDGSLPREVRGAMNSGHQGDVQQGPTPLDHANFRILHSSGQELELKTDAEGRTEVVLHPGTFELRCEEGSDYDRLVPSTIQVPFTFKRFEFCITALMKKQCTFQVVDHLNRPFPRFPLKLTARDSNSQPVSLMTKANGRARGRVGMGVHIATYESSEEPSSWPIANLAQELEVKDIQEPQLFRICVHRVRHPCDIVIRTRCDEPVRQCPFTIRSSEGKLPKVIASGITTELGVANCDLPVGKLHFSLEPGHLSPFVNTQFDIQVNELGDFLPNRFQVDTKSAEVDIHLVTPDGETASFCKFSLWPKFTEAGSRVLEVVCRTDANGVATATLCLLEPYVFRIKGSGPSGAEYMSQEFAFVTDRRAVTVVVARSVLCEIPEENVVFLVDGSGSMQAYLQDVKAALNLALIQQFHKTTKRFNVVSFTEGQVEFRHELVESSQSNVEDAMRFCEYMKAGGMSNLSAALRRAYRFKKVQAVYLITDGKCEVNEEVMTHLKIAYLGHPLRPKLHTVGINCVPGRLSHRALQSLADMTQGNFRAVCLEQEHSSLASGFPKGLDFPGQSGLMPSTDEEPVTGPEEDAEYDDSGFEGAADED